MRISEPSALSRTIMFSAPQPNGPVSRVTVAEASRGRQSRRRPAAPAPKLTAKVASLQCVMHMVPRGLCGRAASLYCALPRRDGRVAEGARLESVYTGNRIVGSNPTPSAMAFPGVVLRRQIALPKAGIFGFLRVLSRDSGHAAQRHDCSLSRIFLWS